MSDMTFDSWGILELMGRKIVAGHITRGEPFPALIRVDVPATSEYPEYTQFYGESAVYCITPTSEDVARRTAEATKINPISVYVPDLVTKAEWEAMQEKLRQKQLVTPEDDAPF